MFSWDEVQTMRNRVERLEGCNRAWDTETYEASNVKVLLRTSLCKDRFCPNCQAVKRTILWNRLQPYAEQGFLVPYDADRWGYAAFSWTRQ